MIIELVLATDLKHHAQLCADFKELVLNGGHELSKEGAPPELVKTKSFKTKRMLSEPDFCDPKVKSCILKCALKCADVSNPARPMAVYEGWIVRVVQEFYNQGDTERAVGLPPSPFMDRCQPDSAIWRLQAGFIDFVVHPLYKASKSLLDRGLIVFGLFEFRFHRLCRAPLSKVNGTSVSNLAARASTRLTLAPDVPVKWANHCLNRTVKD
jgi:hypothetical protein